ncbi:hypothetical protein PP175_18310 [Aneurinibacillus sp. Ricciae_BoGa-3]|uniref:hypothetical protein n=1 Tax=Aneurinibacillus sp. Ricciae_BoGa-3 TaxID=3022697 RepID=UPI0023402115|nr:hypothetical protein [Aneurinibacillus sp. Ricciae_BoGa-3]WCK53319.1 hypothetical protein PP175_18310 [Aneurinibacillus sp. Ricciae_BoGa-3]
MKKPVVIIVLLAASLSLIDCSTQSKASSDTASMKTAFTIGSMPDYIATSVDKLYQEASVVIVGKFEKDNKSFVDHDTIETESHMKVTKLLKGSLTDSEMKNGIDIVYYGGEVTLDTYLKNKTPVPEKVDSKGIVHKPKQYSKQERETEKVVYKVEQQANKDKDKNSEIMVFLSRNPAPNNYFVLADAFGYRKINNKGEVFNPITNSYEKVDFYSKN